MSRRRRSDLPENFEDLTEDQIRELASARWMQRFVGRVIQVVGVALASLAVAFGVMAYNWTTAADGSLAWVWGGIGVVVTALLGGVGIAVLRQGIDVVRGRTGLDDLGT